MSRGKGSAWAVRGANGAVEMLLSAPEIAAAGPAERALAGFDVRVSIIDPLLDVEPEIPRHAHIIVVEVRPSSESSLRYLTKLRAGHPHARIVAAVHDPALPIVRALLRAGAHDVITLPLDTVELAQTLAQICEDATKGEAALISRGRVVTFVQSVGGVGATSLLTQTAALYAEREGHGGRETCLFDLDIQFGTAATYLGLSPVLGLRDLLEAGARVDPSMLRTTAARHGSGLHVFAAPSDMMPLEAVNGDEICELIDLAAEDYDTVFVDLPANWTNWSLSVVARSDLVLLVTELSIASLRQARRVLDLIEQQDLADVKVQIVMNRVERKLFGAINLRDAATALRRPISFTVANDFWLMSSALDQGVVLSEVKPKNRIGRDLETLIQGIDMVLAERS